PRADPRGDRRIFRCAAPADRPLGSPGTGSGNGGGIRPRRFTSRLALHDDDRDRTRGRPGERPRGGQPSAELAMSIESGSRRRPVIVAGAGPVGLSAALAVRAARLPATMLEAEPEDRVRPGPRASYVHGASLRVLERIHPGLGGRLAERGVVWPTRRTLWRGREVFARTYHPSSKSALPHFTSLPQTEV